MKKQLLKTLLLGVISLIATGAWAADPDLTNDYTLVKSVEWGDGVNIAGSGACAHTAYDTGNKKQQSLTILTAPEDAAGWIAMQAWTDGSGKGWWNRSEKGLYCVNAGRSACVFGDDLTTGWLVVFECTTSASSVMTLTNGSGDPDGTFSYVASEDGQKYFCTITAATDAYVGFCGNKNAGFISKISVYKPNKAVVLTSYTVNYVDMGGNTLKESVTYDAVGGTEISLSDADKANIIVGDDTYVYDSDDTEGKIVAEDGSSVVTVKFHLAQNFNYIVNEMCGGTAVRVTENFSYETAKVTVPYRKYNAVDGQLYTKGATNKEYNYSFTLTQDNQVENIGYEAVSGVDNVVFLTEGEDIEGLTPCNSANTAIRSSNSASAYAGADTKIVTLGPGTYKMHAIIYDASKTPDSHWIFMAGETQIADFNCTTVNIQEFDSEEFTLTDNADIIMAAAGGNNMGLDALYITGTGSTVAVANKAIGLVPGVWAVDGAIFAAYAWNDTGDAWFPFVEVSGAYATQIPENYTGIILTRINPAGTDTNPWNNVWNQTDDIDFTAIADGTVFTITGWGEGDGAKSTYTTGDVPTDLTELKATLAKVIELAKIFGYDTTAAEALLASDEATAEQLTTALQTLATGAKDKANETVDLAEAFFEQFDGTAAAALAEYFAAAKAALAGDDIDAMLAAAQTLVTKALEEGQSSMTKVDNYLRMMNNETVNTDLDNIQTALATNNLQTIIAAIRQLKDHISDAATEYVAGVSTIITEGATAGKDVTAMQTAYSSFMTVALKYKNNEATLVEMGYALYNLIKAVEDYKLANCTYTIAGTKDLTGTENDWDIVEANNMTKNEETGLYEWTAENITVTADNNPAFKVVIKDFDGNETWVPASDESGDHNWIITTDVVGGEGVYTITITFNTETQDINVTGVKAESGEEDAELVAPEGWTNAITNGNLAGDDVSSYVAKAYPSTAIDPATIVAGAGKNGSRGILVKTANDENAEPAAWDSQFWIVLPEVMATGTTIHVEFDYMASQAAKATTQSHGTPGAFKHWAAIGDVNFTTEWQHFSADFEVPGEADGMQSIAFNLQEELTATDYHFDNFGVWYKKPTVIDDWTDIIVNGNMEGESAECFYVTEQGIGGPFIANFTEGIGVDGSKAVKVESYDDPAQDWDSQFFIRLPYQVPAGTKYKVSFDYKADKAGDFDTQSHTEPGGYIHWACVGNGSFTDSWKTYEAEGTVSADMSKEGQLFQTIAFNLAKNKVATCFVFDNVKFEVPTDALSSLILNPALNPTPYTKPVYNSMAIVGDFLGLSTEENPNADWDPANGWQMTQDAENEAVWTLVVDEFTAEAKTYEYKATANGNWDDYVLPNDKNADYNFDTANLGAGKYKLTFTVDTRKHQVNLDVEKLDVTTYTATFTTDAEWEEVYAYAWSGEGANVTEFLGAWPGEKLEADAAGVYTVNIVSTDAPEMIIFNNGNSGEGNQTANFEFVNGGAYEYKKPTGEEDPELVAPKGWVSLVTNGNLAGDETSNYVMKEYPSNNIVPAAIVAGAGTNGSRGILIKAGDDNENASAQDWDSQFWIVLNEELPSGSKLHVEFDYKASEAALANTQAHGSPGSYQHWAAIGDVNFTTEWQHFSNDIVVDDAMAKGDNGNGSGTGLKSIAFNLAVNRNAVNYQLDNFGVWYEKPIEITSMAIVGNFLGLSTEENPNADWDPANGWEMEQDAENPAVWTLTKPFTAEAKTYEYKAVANGNWDDYVLPADDNAKFVFGTGEYPVGDYKLVFTADTENNTLDLTVKPASILTFTATFTTNAYWWEEVYAYAWSGEGENVTEYLGGWPGTKLKVDAAGIYTVTIEGEVAPEMIVFSNGNTGEGNQTEDLAFEVGKAYQYVFAPTFDFENNNGNWADNATFESGFTLDDVTLTGIKNVKYINGQLRIGNRTGSFKLSAPEGKNITKIELKVLGAETINLTPSTGEVAITKTLKQGAEEEATVVYSIWTWTGKDTEVSFDLSGAMQRNLGFINVTLEENELTNGYYLVGNMNDWQPSEDYMLVLNEEAEGVEEYKITRDLEADAQFKVVKVDGETLTYYPSGEGNAYGENGELQKEGNYTIYFRPNGDGGSDWFYNVIFAVLNSTDGINAVTVNTENAVIYNMKGQRVTKAQKGLYIVNGKKQFVK